MMMMRTRTRGGDRYAAAAQEDRSAPRTRVSLAATLDLAGEDPRPVTLHDISLTGFSVTATDRLAKNTRCWLTIPDVGRFEALSVWWEPGRGAGFALEQLLDSTVLDEVVNSAR